MHRRFKLTVFVLVTALGCADAAFVGPTATQATPDIEGRLESSVTLTNEQLTGLEEYIPEYNWAVVPRINSGGSSATWGAGTERNKLSAELKGSYSDAHWAGATPYLRWFGPVEGEASFPPKTVFLATTMDPAVAAGSGSWTYPDPISATVGSLCNTRGEMIAFLGSERWMRYWMDKAEDPPARYVLYKSPYETRQVHQAPPQGTQCSAAQTDPYPSAGPCDDPSTSLIEECEEPFDHTTETREKWTNGGNWGFTGYYFCPTTIYYVTTVYGTFPTGQTWSGNCSWNINIARMSSVVGVPELDSRLLRVRIEVQERLGHGNVATVRVMPHSVTIFIAMSAMEPALLWRTLDIAAEGVDYKQRRGSRSLTYHVTDVPPAYVFDPEKRWLEGVLHSARTNGAVTISLADRPR